MANAKPDAKTQAFIDAELGRLQKDKDEKKAMKMAIHEADTAAGRKGVDRSLFPKMWQRLKNKVDEEWGGLSEVEEGMPAIVPTRTGANVTLDDLAARQKGRDFDALRRGLPIQTDGWIGTPDPIKFKDGTNVLDEEELAEEVAKGNVIRMTDFVDVVNRMSDADKALLYKATLQDYMENRAFFHLGTDQEGEDKVVSFWDMYSYVHHNPELKALVDRRRMVPTLRKGEHGEEGVGGSDDSEDLDAVWKEQKPGQKWMRLSKEAARKMPCGLVSQGEIWQRRPTRWLRGVDGVLDYDFGMYAEEEAVENLLGPRYGGQDPREVISQEQYKKDVLRAGPLMGMTFLITAARELPIVEQREQWADRLSRALANRLEKHQSAPSRLLPPPDEIKDPDALNHMEAFSKLYDMMDPDSLAQSTCMLDTTGKRLRQGSSFVLRTGPLGHVTVQAISPGGLREREHYLLGTFENVDVCRSILDIFLSDQDAVDPQFVKSTRNNLLLFANGFRQGNSNDNPNVVLSDGSDDEDKEGGSIGRRPQEVTLTSDSLFWLPPVGSKDNSKECWQHLLTLSDSHPMVELLKAEDEERQRGSLTSRNSTLLLQGVRERVLAMGLDGIFQHANLVAMRVPVPELKEGESPESLQRRHMVARQAAADADLLRGAELFSVQGLGSFVELFSDVKGAEEEPLET